MGTEDFDRIQKRMRENFRRAQERAQRRMFAASGLSAANRAILENFRRRVDEIGNAVDSMYKRVEDALQKSRGAQDAPRSPGTGDEHVGVSLPPPENPLNGLSVRVLHKLEKLDSYLRHSVVEVCLNNLKIFAQLAPAKMHDPGFAEKVMRCIPSFPAAAAEISAMFEKPLEDDIALCVLFADEHAALLEHLADIEAILRDAGETKPDDLFWQRFSAGIPLLIDGVLTALGAVTTAIGGIRIPLFPIVQMAANLFRPRCEEKNIALAVFDKTDRPSTVFADGTALLNVFVELLRNACRHAFGPSSPDKKIEMAVSYADRDRRTVQVEVSDNGVGIPPEILDRLGQRGVGASGSGDGIAHVMNVIRRDHLGDIKITSRAGKGVKVSVILPVKLDL